MATKKNPVKQTKFVTTGYSIEANKVTVSFENENGKNTKTYIILEEKDKIEQLLELSGIDFIFNTMKKLSEAGLVTDRQSLEEELGL